MCRYTNSFQGNFFLSGNNFGTEKTTKLVGCAYGVWERACLELEAFSSSIIII